MRARTTSTVPLATALIALSFDGQSPGLAATSWTHEFTSAHSACERSDGSVIATDAGEAGIVHLTRGGVRTLGRSGLGPGEYQTPSECFLLSGDTVLVFDRVVRRFVLVPPEGALSTLSFPRSLGTNWYDAIGIDERGAIVLLHRGSAGTARIMRWDRATGAIDSSDSIATGEVRALRAGGMSLQRPIPFSPQPGVVAAPSVGVAIAIAEPVFRVDILRGARVVTGSEIPYEVVPVDDGDIEQYIVANSPPPGTVGMNSRGERVSLGAAKRTLANFGLTRDDFPATKPPFDPTRVFASPDARIWIRMHRRSAETAERYEVWDAATGRRGAPVTLPAGQKLVGLGRNGLVFVITTDQDGLQTLHAARAG